MASVEEPVQVVGDKGVAVAGEQVVVPVLKLLHAFSQSTIPCRLYAGVEKLIALRVTRD